MNQKFFGCYWTFEHYILESILKNTSVEIAYMYHSFDTYLVDQTFYYIWENVLELVTA